MNIIDLVIYCKLCVINEVVMPGSQECELEFSLIVKKQGYFCKVINYL